MPSVLPFRIPADLAATSPGAAKNPSPNLLRAEQAPDSPPAPSFFTIGSPTAASVTYRAVMSDFSVGSMQEKPYVIALIAPATADIADNPNATWRQLRDVLELPVTVHLTREDGSTVRGYDLILATKLKAVGNGVIVHLEGPFGSVRN